MIILLAAAVLPAVFLLSRVNKMDTIEKEPWPILRKLLIFGALGGKSDGEDVLTATARRLAKPATYVRMDVDFDIK